MSLTRHTRRFIQHGLGNVQAGKELTAFLDFAVSQTTGNVYYVDSGTGSDAAGNGKTKDAPFATLDYAFGSHINATSGDIIFVMAGHSETLSAAITMDKAGVTVIGLGDGTARPQFTGNFAGDNVTVTAANVTIVNLYFNESTDVATANINIAAANCHVCGCHFDVGDANNLECITITAAGDNALIEANVFNVTGNGPDAAIEIEAAGVDRTVIRNNIFICSDGTNAFDAGAINSTVANTNLIVTGNTFLGAGAVSNAVVAASAVDKSVLSNFYGSDAINVDQDQFSGQVTVTAAAPPLVVDDTIWYVDSVDGNASFDGHTPQTALVTIAAAVAAAAAGDTIIVASGHAETLTTGVTFNLAGLTILGSGTGTRRPSITGNVADDTFSLDSANIVLKNFIFNEATSVTGGAVNVAAANCVIEGCQFDLGANDAEAITITSAGDNLRIENNHFKVTANGPTAAIEIEGASSDLIVRGNTFDGGSDTNAWDAAAINSTAAATGILIEDNHFRFCLSGQEFITLTAVTEPPIIRNNTYQTGAALASQLNPPSTFYVDSDKGNDVAGAGRSWHTPCATIDFAVGLCSASAGDTILVAPGHTESISGATDLVMDIAGVTVKGLGSGPLRPRLTFDTDAGAVISVTAANCRLENLWLYSDFTNGITIGISVAAGGDGLVLKDIVMEEAANTKEFLVGVNVAAAAHDIRIENFKFFGILGGDNSSCINFDGASDRTFLKDIYIHGDFSASVIDHLAAASVGLFFDNIVFYQDDAAAGLGVDVHDSSTGMMVNCRGMNKKDTVEAFTGNLMGYSECYGSNAVNVQGILKPVADT